MCKADVDISTIVTAHNEGRNLEQTIASIYRSSIGCSLPLELVVVDDGSTDGSLGDLDAYDVRIIRHHKRLGVAPSRNAAAGVSHSSVLAFVDGHQRFSPSCLQQCADIAVAREAIVWPDVRGIRDDSPLIHGATFMLCPENSWFTANYIHRRPRAKVSRITSLRAPGYVMPRTVYEKVKWPTPLRGWGASEAAVSLKAFFAGIPILHLCGPLARHKFKKRFHYEVTTEGFAWNQAVVARMCFDERTWHDYWLPTVFAKVLSDEMQRELDSPAIRDEQRDFQKLKVRSDRDFWTSLIKLPLPQALRRKTVGSHSGGNRKALSQKS